MAVDWSGDATAAGQRRRIFVASWRDGAITLNGGYTREEVCALLLRAAGETPDLVVGLDFAFSFPAWWLREQGCQNVFALWQLASEQGERWLSECRPPFWGRPGKLRPSEHREPLWRGLRKTDRCFAAKSPFQIGGSGAVGTGSIRGMPMLTRLHQAGFHVWPFQPAKLPMALEIYPRLLTGPVVKSSQNARTLYLKQPRYAKLPPEILAKAVASEDAFDALCSVLGMVEHAADLHQLSASDDPDEHLEGTIWNPMIGRSAHPKNIKRVRTPLPAEAS